MGAGPIGAHLATLQGGGRVLGWLLSEALAFGLGAFLASYVFNTLLNFGDRFPRPFAGDWKAGDFLILGVGIAAAASLHTFFWAVN